MEAKYEVICTDRFSSRPEIAVNPLEMPTDEARFALSCIERWGLVAAKDDGVDDAGRQKLAPIEPDELVERAFSIATKAFVKARELGLMISLPTWAEAETLADERRKTDKN